MSDPEPIREHAPPLYRTAGERWFDALDPVFVNILTKREIAIMAWRASSDLFWDKESNKKDKP